MDYTALRSELYSRIAPSEPNEWDIEDALERLQDLAEAEQRALLEAVPKIWPVSHSLSFSFLKEAALHVHELDEIALAEWLRRILHNYEQGGLKQARAYMAEPDHHLHGDSRQESAVLASQLGRLQAFARGLAGLKLQLQAGDMVSTDTETIFLPAEVAFFRDFKENIMFFKLVIALQCCCILQGSFGRHRFMVPKTGGLKDDAGAMVADVSSYFEQFEEPQLARDVYQLAELYRAFRFLQRHYPGLVRETRHLRHRIHRQRRAKGTYRTGTLERLFEKAVIPEEKGAPGSRDIQILHALNENSGKMQGQMQALQNVCHSLSRELCADDGYAPFDFSPYMAPFRFVEAERLREKRIAKNNDGLATSLADFFEKQGLADDQLQEGNSAMDMADGVKIQAGNSSEENNDLKSHEAIIINNSAIELPQEMLELVRRFEADMGGVPEGLISTAFGLAGGGRSVEQHEDEKLAETVGEFIAYDEWDYRRHGYRKDWCSLRERVLNGVKSDFVERTLEKHRGPYLKIRRRFEMMRTSEHFARRRRYGDDLDLDAMVDSMGDRRAGLAPSERLFIRLIRDQRSIFTNFLVDMSNSTEGWVGECIKEALVLLCAAMEIVGDAYGIYGFSGMRRMRSEVYTIKDAAHRYDGEVRQRLAAIVPKEYTRMGPPIRHMIEKFGNVEARSRLLLILSDGKPEDYDDYKGQYAIEDTRKALAEVRGRGIHTYCITIDRESHEYLEYLFGKGNYTYIKNIDQLPARLTEIYRLLTG
ncbi:MAG: nitric oxide reductase activation protein NorD [Desulfopila sp.]